jgi:hypothetical protein
MKKIFHAFFAAALLLAAVPALAAETPYGSVIKASGQAVYYYGIDGKRYVFPNEKTYRTWYGDFTGVLPVADAFLASLSIGGNVTYKPGAKLVKITTDPKVYAVSADGALRWIKTEAVAMALYGTDWNKQVDDVPDAFFTNYKIGSDIASVGDYSPSAEAAAAVSISVDKNLTSVAPVETPIQLVYAWKAKNINSDVYYHRGLEFANFNGGYMVTWYDDRNGQNEVYFQKTDSDAASDGTASRVSETVNDSTAPESASDGINMYTVWEDSSSIRRAIYAEKFDHEGNKVRQILFASSTIGTSRYPSIAWNSLVGNYGIVWWDTKSNLNSPQGDLFFSMMTQTGLKYGLEPKITSAPSLDFQAKVISAGDRFAIVWQGDDMTIKFAAITQYSTLADTVKTIYTANGAGEPKIAWSGTGYSVIWSDKVSGYYDIHLALLDSAGNRIGDVKRLTSGGKDSTEPDIVWNGGKFYVAYTNGATGAADIKIVKLDKNGVITDAAVSISSAGKSAYSPKLAINGTKTGVAWLEDDGAVNKIMGAVETKQQITQ